MSDESVSQYTIGGFERMQQRIAELECEKAELAAQVGRQQTYIDGLKCMIERYNEAVAKQCRKEAWHEDHPLVQISTMTPEQCLRQIQAEAVRDFILWGTLEMDPEFAEFKDSAETYIAQLDDEKAYAQRVAKGE